MIVVIGRNEEYIMSDDAHITSLSHRHNNVRWLLAWFDVGVHNNAHDISFIGFVG